MTKTSITISSKHCERACVLAIKKYNSLLEKEWEEAIEQQMTKKPWLWVFDKPSKTREEAKSVILANNPWFGFWQQSAIAQIQGILEMCLHSDEITISKKDFRLIKNHMR